MALSLRNVVVVYKQPPARSRRMPARAAQQHLATLEELYQILQQQGIPFRAIPMEQLGSLARADLVITVGGDGTFLATSHYVHRAPMLGIKSIGQPSVGYFCVATRTTMARYLRQLVAGKHTPIALARLAVSIGRRRLQEPVLNECLFSHGSPAAISDYRLCVGRVCEAQRSSGLWVATAAGSSAAIKAAGGTQLPLTATDLQYLVREPYMHRPYQLLHGVLPPQSILRIISHCAHGTLSIDGAHIQYPVPEGVVITIRQSQRPLQIYWKR